MSKPPIRRKSNRMAERRAHTRNPGVVTAAPDPEPTPAPEPEVEQAPTVAPAPAPEPAAEPTPEPEPAPAPEPTAGDEENPRQTAPAKATKKKAAPAKPRASKPSRGGSASAAPTWEADSQPRMTLTISAEVADALQDLRYDELEATGKMPTMWRYYERALAEFLPTAQEAQVAAADLGLGEGDELAVEDGIPVYTHIAPRTRRGLSRLRQARTVHGEKVSLAWFYTEATRRLIAARTAELEAVE